jgi:hypothetical protein
VTLKEENRLRVFENRVLRRIFGPKRGAVMGGCRKIHNEELCDLYSLPNIITKMKWWHMRWEVHVARKGVKKKHTRYWWKSQRERDY